MTTVFTITYQKYGTQNITVTISKLTGDEGHYLITKSTEIPTAPQNNHIDQHTFKLEAGVPHWLTNDAVPPADTIKEYFIDQVPSFNFKATEAKRTEQTNKVCADYRRKMRNVKPSAEEMFEMRANFAPGTTLVNVITGRKTRV